MLRRFLEEFDTLQNIGGAYNFLSFDTSHLHYFAWTKTMKELKSKSQLLQNCYKQQF